MSAVQDHPWKSTSPSCVLLTPAELHLQVHYLGIEQYTRRRRDSSIIIKSQDESERQAKLSERQAKLTPNQILLRTTRLVNHVARRKLPPLLQQLWHGA